MKADKRIDDSITLEDKIIQGDGLWAKTEVIGGYDLSYDINGKSTLGTVTFKRKNTVPIGGVQNVMEYLFGVEGPITVPTLYQQRGIGYPDSAPTTETYLTPDGSVNVIYPYGRIVQLFGVGITGTAENTLTEYPVDYRENDITMQKHNSDGTTLTGIQIPFRYTSTPLSAEDRLKYYGKRLTGTGETAYYLKRFERAARIKHIWKSSDVLETDDDDQEVEISNADVWNLERADKASSFTEMVLRITPKDLKEFFINQDQADMVRFNCISLYLGRYRETTDAYGEVESADYEDVTLFSKVNIPMESMKLNKDWYCIYRVYGR